MTDIYSQLATERQRMRQEQRRREMEQRRRALEEERRRQQALLAQQQQAQGGQQGQQPNPMQAWDMYQQFSGGGTAASGSTTGATTGATTGTTIGGTAGASGATTAGAAGSTAGGAAGGGAASSGGMLASAGPWAALAAVIIGNETNARKKGYRSEDTGEYAKDLLTGEVLSQDLEQRWLPKMFGKDLKNDKLGLGADMLAGSQIASGNFSDAWKTIKDDSLLGKLF